MVCTSTAATASSDASQTMTVKAIWDGSWNAPSQPAAPHGAAPVALPAQTLWDSSSWNRQHPSKCGWSLNCRGLSSEFLPLIFCVLAAACCCLPKWGASPGTTQHKGGRGGGRGTDLLYTTARGPLPCQGPRTREANGNVAMCTGCSRGSASSFVEKKTHDGP